MNELTLGFITIILLVLIQIALFAYGYGKISQKVTDISKVVDKNVERLEKLESLVTRG